MIRSTCTFALVALLTATTASAQALGAPSPATTSAYDFDMKPDMQALIGLVQKLGINVPAGALPESDGSSVMTALKEQFGLKLDSTRGPVNVLVVDSVEALTPD